MTTRKELVALGHQHTGKIAGVVDVMIAIQEAKNEIDLATWQLSVRAGSAINFKNNDSYEVAGSFVEEAAKYERGAAAMKSSLLTLASILQHAGLHIDY